MKKVFTVVICLSVLVAFGAVLGLPQKNTFHLEAIDPLASYKKTISHITSDGFVLYDNMNFHDHYLDSYRNKKNKINIEIAYDKNDRIIYAREFANGNFLGNGKEISMNTINYIVELAKEKYGYPGDHIDYVDEKNIERKIWQWKLENHHSIFEIHAYKKRGRDEGYSYLKTLATPFGGQGFVENMAEIRHKIAFRESMSAHNTAAPEKPDKL